MDQKKKIVKGFFLGVDHEDIPQFAPIGEMGAQETIELMMTVLYDIMHIPLKFGVPKEEVYDFTVENFSLMVDKFLPEKVEINPEVAKAMLDAEQETITKLAEEKRKNKKNYPFKQLS